MASQKFRCSVCRTQSPSNAALVIHLYRAHNRLARRFQCTTYPKRFATSTALRVHQVVHTDARLFKCSQCIATFKDARCIRLHLSNVHPITAISRSFKCCRCERSFKAAYELSVHLRSHDPSRPFKCRHCPARFKLPSTCNLHQDTHNLRRQLLCKCTTCGAVLANAKCLVRHKRLVHGPKQPFACRQCPAVFQSQSVRDRHFRFQHSGRPQVIVCARCKAVFADKGRLQRHLRTGPGTAKPISMRCVTCLSEARNAKANDQTLSCCRCQSSFDTKYRLMRHMAEMHSASAQPGACGICFATLTNSDAQRNYTRVSRSGKGKPLFECKICHAQLKSFYGLRYHQLKVHSFEFQTNSSTHGWHFGCSLCLAIFQNSQHLYIHLHRLCAKRGKRYKCTLCSSAFQTNTGLNLHRGAHVVKNGELRVFYCCRCNARFTFIGYLRRHLQAAHKEHRCRECPRSFKTIQEVRAHKWQMRALNKRQLFRCAQCSKISSQKGSLATHLAVHNPVKAFKCPHCPAAFGLLLFLKPHIREQHDAAFGKPYKCTECAAAFKRRNVLRKHQSIHSKRPYVCSRCCKVCSYCSQVTNHHKTHKNELAF